ncbi:MAG TPA: 4Fe-4S dicluster domain-containing protein [Burkholderiales bacterium]|nr:4Fe-4S dicluster domain-containing protein [Burkholderiales bacterium]
MSAVAEKTPTPRWGMVIDLNRCVGCQTCTIACKHANDTSPGVQWRRVLDVEQGTFPDVERLFLVVGCQHCADPPCVPVCPTGATRQRADGLVTMNYDVCIGCANCAVSCPYQARTIVHEADGYYGAKTRQEQATAHPERLGVAQKCTFCQDRVESGLARGLKPGVDPEATPACSSSCISQAIQFGDFHDPQSHVSQLLRDQPSMQLNADAGTDPQIKYLYTTPAVPGRDSTALEEDEERLADPANPLVGSLQKFWDWRAAMNWICGGIGAGLAIVTGLALLAGWIDAARAPMLYLVAAAIVTVGLFCVFLKIGRQARFWRAASRPQTSWMTRELYAALVFYPAVLACWIAPGPGVFGLASVSAAAFLWCQAKILHRARGIPAWRAPLVPWMILASGLLEGIGVLMLFGTNAAVVALGAVMVIVNFTLWRSYVGSARGQGIPPLSRRALHRISWPLHLLGHAIPLALLAASWLVPPAAGVLVPLCGLAILAGGALWKYGLVVRAGHFQGFRLPHMPQRGSGTFAAPARLDLAGMARRTA